MKLIISPDDVDHHADRSIRQWTYNALDCCVTHEVDSKLEPLLDDIARTMYQFNLTMNAPALAMTQRGISIDLNKRADVVHLFRERLERLESMLYRFTTEVWGVALNPRSTPQLKNFFYGLLQLPIVYTYDKATRMRKPSVNRESLEKLAAYYAARPVVQLLLALRDTKKKLEIPETAIDADGRFRATFNVAGTKNMRWSSNFNAYGTGANVQNITDEMREMFVPDTGKKFGSRDLEQAESRAVAYLAGDAKYIHACESGDLHTTVAKLVWPNLSWPNTPAGDKELAESLMHYRHFSKRYMAKRGGHLSNYNGKPNMMAKHLKIPEQLAWEFQLAYFSEFQDIRSWQTAQIRKVASERCLITPMGVRRFFFGRVEEGEGGINSAIAFEPQSLVATIMNVGLYRLWYYLELEAQLIEILAQVHDAALYQYDPANEAEVMRRTEEAMLVPVQIGERTLIIPSEASCGWNWRKQEKKIDPVTKEVKVTNEHGLAKYKASGDTRSPPTKLPILDRRVL